MKLQLNRQQKKSLIIGIAILLFTALFFQNRVIGRQMFLNSMNLRNATFSFNQSLLWLIDGQPQDREAEPNLDRVIESADQLCLYLETDSQILGLHAEDAAFYCSRLQQLNEYVRQKKTMKAYLEDQNNIRNWKYTIDELKQLTAAAVFSTSSFDSPLGYVISWPLERVRLGRRFAQQVNALPHNLGHDRANIME